MSNDKRHLIKDNRRTYTEKYLDYLVSDENLIEKSYESIHEEIEYLAIVKSLESFFSIKDNYKKVNISPDRLIKATQQLTLKKFEQDLKEQSRFTSEAIKEIIKLFDYEMFITGNFNFRDSLEQLLNFDTVDAVGLTITFFEMLSQSKDKMNSALTIHKTFENIDRLSDNFEQTLDNNAWRLAYLFKDIRYNEQLLNSGNEVENRNMLLENIGKDELKGITETYSYLRKVIGFLYAYIDITYLISYLYNIPTIKNGAERYSPKDTESIDRLIYETQMLYKYALDYVHTKKISPDNKDVNYTEIINKIIPILSANDLKDIAPISKASFHEAMKELKQLKTHDEVALKIHSLHSSFAKEISTLNTGGDENR